MTMDQTLQLMNPRNTGTGYVVNCENYQLKYANPSMLKLLNQEIDSWEGQLCYTFLYGRSSPCDFCKMHKTKIGHTSRWYMKSEFNHKPILMRDFKIQAGEETLFLQTCFDIPEATQELRLLTASMTAEQLLTACAKTLTGGEGSVELLLEEITDFYGASGAFLFYHQEDQDQFTLGHSHCPQGGMPAQLPSFPLAPEAPWAKALEASPYLLLEGQNLDPFPQALQELYRHFPQGDFLLTQVQVQDQLQGILGIFQVSDHQEDCHLVPTVVGFLSNYFTKRQAIQQLESQSEACETVLRAVKTLVTEEDLNQGIRQLLTDLTQYFQGDRGFLLKNNQGQLEITNQYHKQQTAPTLRQRGQSLQEMEQWFSQLGQDNILLLRNAPQTLAPQWPEEGKRLETQGVDSILGIRLEKKGETTFFLLVDNPRVHQKNGTILRSITQFVETHLAKDLLLKKLSELSFTDSLTGLYNRNFYKQYVDHEGEKGLSKHLGILYVDVNSLKKANDNFGHELGDILLKWTADFLKQETDGVCFRLGGDEFLCILEHCSLDHFQEKQKSIQKRLSTYPEKHLSIGWYYASQGSHITQAVQEADKAMYQEKQRFYRDQAQDDRSVYQMLQEFKRNVENLENEYESWR